MASFIPRLAAVVAAPLRKLWPENGSPSTPALVSAAHTLSTSLALVNGFLSWKMNSGLGPAPLVTRQSIIAITGHKVQPVRPTNMSTPALKGSVFDTLSLTRSVVGLVSCSTATSSNVRCRVSSNAESDGTVISPDLRKPQKHSDTAAHNILSSQPGACLYHTVFIFCSNSMVIGWRTSGLCLAACTYHLDSLQYQL